MCLYSFPLSVGQATHDYYLHYDLAMVLHVVTITVREDRITEEGIKSNYFCYFQAL